jgi:hypothetical protein
MSDVISSEKSEPPPHPALQIKRLDRVSHFHLVRIALKAILLDASVVVVLVDADEFDRASEIPSGIPMAASRHVTIAAYNRAQATFSPTVVLKYREIETN